MLLKRNFHTQTLHGKYLITNTFLLFAIEFVTVLADQTVEHGGDLELSCEANTNAVTATWEKDGKRLACVQGKHTMSHTGKLFILEIRNAQEEDEGTYTLTLSNISGKVSCSATIHVGISNKMINNLKQFQICDKETPELHFLLHGPIGAGKSSVINTIKSIFEKRQYINCLAATACGKSFTEKYQKYAVDRFVFHDVMGLEFDPESPISENSTHYIKNPTPDKKIYCLVGVLPADNITMINDEVFKKMKRIREEASELGMPQAVLLTRVDKACPMTNADLSKIYKSKKIKKKVDECSVKLSVPMNCIFPVKNYHEETQLNEEINCLMLDALTHLVNWANDFLKNEQHKIPNPGFAKQISETI
ncbi:hypothetical protein NFI96_017520 [Prochilodus magdalenae]|nr:hypothetical protein NFI96_017520 [Prochilodus magdalenae]